MLCALDHCTDASALPKDSEKKNQSRRVRLDCRQTWHVRGKPMGLMCFHVDDIMVGGPKNDPEFKCMMDKVKRLNEGGWCERNEFDQCGCRIRQATDKSVTVDQECYARKIGLITMSAHRRKHMTETLSDEEHTVLMAKRGELNLLATQSMIQLLAPLSVIDRSKTATGQSLKNLNRFVRQAHCKASDKLHYPVISDPVFVSFADVAWANMKAFGSQCGYLCIGTERSLLDGCAAPCCPISWHSRGCPRVARSSGSVETQSATQAQEETEFIRLLWLEIVQGGCEDTVIDEEIANVGGCLIIDAKGVFDAIHRSESAALSMQDKRSAVEGLALREGNWSNKNLAAMVSQRSECR